MKYFILYNPKAGNACIKVQAVEKHFPDAEFVYIDVTGENGYSTLFEKKQAEDNVIVCGGDGTLNRFVNAIKDRNLSGKIYYYACGSGNDFLRDVAEDGNQLVDMENYLKDLPTVTVDGKDYAFLNGVGFGIDGYCCEVGDKLRAQSDKPVNYTGVAIKGLLFHYRPTNATVIVDGKEYFFKKVWIAPTMNGRYYGGGMLPAPEQRREQAKLSVTLFHGSGRLKTLMIFPSIFKGEHIKHEKFVTIHTGYDVSVKFDRPTALQIDGETILGVTEYTAKAKVPAVIV